jgi:Protein of unknown function (DUF2934)
MADSSNARGSFRATGRKSARKTGTASSPTKAAGKSQKATPAKASSSIPLEPKATPRVAPTLPTAERQRMIAEAAYYLSQRRGTAPGNPHQDWLEAEAEIDALLLRRLTDD